MYSDRTSAEQLAIVSALVSVVISRKLTLEEMGLVGDFLEILGDMLQAMQAQMQYSEQRRQKFKKNCKRQGKSSSNN